MRLKCDGTRAETRFDLSTKRTSPFKSAGASVQSIVGSRVVRISGSNAGYTKFRGSVKRCEGDWLPTPFASFPFTSPPVRHRVPSHFNWTLKPGTHYRHVTCTYVMPKVWHTHTHTHISSCHHISFELDYMQLTEFLVRK